MKPIFMHKKYRIYIFQEHTNNRDGSVSPFFRLLICDSKFEGYSLLYEGHNKHKGARYLGRNAYCTSMKDIVPKNSASEDCYYIYRTNLNMETIVQEHLECLF